MEQVSRKTIEMMYDKKLLYLILDNGEIYYFKKDTFEYVPFIMGDNDIENAVNCEYALTEFLLDLPVSKHKPYVGDYLIHLMFMEKNRVIRNYLEKQEYKGQEYKMSQILAVGEATGMPKIIQDKEIDFIGTLLSRVQQEKKNGVYKIYKNRDVAKILENIKRANAQFLVEDEQERQELRKKLGVK